MTPENAQILIIALFGLLAVINAYRVSLLSRLVELLQAQNDTLSRENTRLALHNYALQAERPPTPAGAGTEEQGE